MTSLSALALTSVLLLAPALIRQGRQLVALLPVLYNAAENGWHARKAGWRKTASRWAGSCVGRMLSRGEEALGAAAPAAMAWVGGMAGSLGKWMLAPVFGFYFLARTAGRSDSGFCR